MTDFFYLSLIYLLFLRLIVMFFCLYCICEDFSGTHVGTSTTSLRTADAFPVVASLPPKNSYFSEGKKRRTEMRLLFAGYSTTRTKLNQMSK